MAKSKIPNLDFYHTIEKAPENFMFLSDEKKREWLSDASFNRYAAYNHFSGFSIPKSQVGLIDENFINFLKKNLTNKYFIIDISDNALLSNKEFNIIAETKLSLEKAGIKVAFSEGYSFYNFDKVCEANLKLDNWANEINNLKIDGKELSQLEKFYVAYSYVTQFEYKESQIASNSRNLIAVLTGNKIVCVGYAQMLKALCSKIGIECDTQLVSVNSRDVNHMNCSVKIKDDKYGINGTYYSDPCYDSYSNGHVSIAHALISYQDIPRVFKKKSINIPQDKTAKNSIDMSSVESIESTRADLSKFLINHKEIFSKYIDEVIKNSSNHIFIKAPKQKDLQQIIDSLIAANISIDDYSKLPKNSSRVNRMIDNELKNQIAYSILKHTNIKSIEEFKTKLFEEMETYLPSYDSSVFLLLSKAYSEFEQKQKTNQSEQEKYDTKNIPFVQFENLLENLEKITGKRSVDGYYNTSKLIIDSLERSLQVCGKNDYGANVFSRLKLIYLKLNSQYGRTTPVTGEEVLSEYRKELEKLNIIPKKENKSSIIHKTTYYDFNNTPKADVKNHSSNGYSNIASSHTDHNKQL